MRLVSGVYWAPRQEGSEPCADRLCGYLKELKEIHVLLGSWIPKGVSRRSLKGLRDISGDFGALKDLLDRGANKTDDAGVAMSDLGFSLGLWNQQSARQSSSISITCGLSFDQAGMLNSVLLTIPQEICDSDMSGAYSKLLSAAATAWEPDWGAIYDPMRLECESITSSKPLFSDIVFISNKLISDELFNNYDAAEEFANGLLCIKRY